MLEAELRIDMQLKYKQWSKHPTLTHVLGAFYFYQKYYYVIVEVGARINDSPDTFNLCIVLNNDSEIGRAICFLQCDIKCDPHKGLKCPFTLGITCLVHCHCHIKTS